MGLLQPAGHDLVMKQLIGNGWKRVMQIIIFVYIIVLFPFFLSWKEGTLFSGIVDLGALQDSGYANQYLFLLPFFVWVSHFYFYPFEDVLKGLYKSGVVKFKSEEGYREFIEDANSIFAHPVVTFGPYVVMVCITIFQVYHYWFSGDLTWYSPYGGEDFTLTSYVVVIPVMLLYYIIPSFVFRVGAMFFVVRRYLAENVQIQPLHPDKCGGLSPLGQFSVRVSIAGIVVGIGILIGLYANLYQHDQQLFSVPNILMMSSYIIGMAVLFFLPLLAAKKGMREAKDRTLYLISDKFNTVFQGTLLMEGYDLKERIETIENLNELYIIANKMPVYPFNSENIIKFLSSIIWPILTLVLSQMIGKLL